VVDGPYDCCFGEMIYVRIGYTANTAMWRQICLAIAVRVWVITHASVGKHEQRVK